MSMAAPSSGYIEHRLAKLTGLVELHTKITAAIAAEEDYLHGRLGISFRVIARIRQQPEWWIAREYHQRHDHDAGSHAV
jgi:hypothetical protein